MATGKAYVERPTELGFYWMKWKPKYRRVWLYDVVWYSPGCPGFVRRIDWDPITRYPRATFSGPLVPPPEGEAAARPASFG